MDPQFSWSKTTSVPVHTGPPVLPNAATVMPGASAATPNTLPPLPIALTQTIHGDTKAVTNSLKRKRDVSASPEPQTPGEPGKKSRLDGAHPACTANSSVPWVVPGLSLAEANIESLSTKERYERACRYLASGVRPELLIPYLDELLSDAVDNETPAWADGMLTRLLAESDNPELLRSCLPLFLKQDSSTASVNSLAASLLTRIAGEDTETILLVFSSLAIHISRFAERSPAIDPGSLCVSVVRHLLSDPDTPAKATLAAVHAFLADAVNHQEMASALLLHGPHLQAEQLVSMFNTLLNSEGGNGKFSFYDIPDIFRAITGASKRCSNVQIASAMRGLAEGIVQPRRHNESIEHWDTKEQMRDLLKTMLREPVDQALRALMTTAVLNALVSQSPATQRRQFFDERHGALFTQIIGDDAPTDQAHQTAARTMRAAREVYFALPDGNLSGEMFKQRTALWKMPGFLENGQLDLEITAISQHVNANTKRERLIELLKVSASTCNEAQFRRMRDLMLDEFQLVNLAGDEEPDLSHLLQVEHFIQAWPLTKGLALPRWFNREFLNQELNILYGALNSRIRVKASPCARELEPSGRAWKLDFLRSTDRHLTSLLQAAEAVKPAIAAGSDSKGSTAVPPVQSSSSPARPVSSLPESPSFTLGRFMGVPVRIHSDFDPARPELRRIEAQSLSSPLRVTAENGLISRTTSAGTTYWIDHTALS